MDNCEGCYWKENCNYTSPCEYYSPLDDFSQVDYIEDMAERMMDYMEMVAEYSDGN